MRPVQRSDEAANTQISANFQHLNILQKQNTSSWIDNFSGVTWSFAADLYCRLVIFTRTVSTGAGAGVRGPGPRGGDLPPSQPSSQQSFLPVISRYVLFNHTVKLIQHWKSNIYDSCQFQTRNAVTESKNRKFKLLFLYSLSFVER
jgi:hypothetical protein